MAGHAAVGIDDDLPPSQPGVAHRAADLEPAGRVDQQPEAFAVDAGIGQHGVDHVVLDVGGEQFLEVDVGRVLSGDHDRVQPHRVVPHVLDRYLRLAVRAQVGHGTRAADLGQLAGELVREHDRQRHQLGGLAARVAEHQALVARPLPVKLVGPLALAVLERVVDALSDVRRLGADRDRHAAGGPVVSLGRGVVADLQDLLPDDARDVDIRLGGDLAGDMYLAGRDQGFHRHAAARIILDHGIQNDVADLVGHLVRMAFCHRLGSEQAARHVVSPRYLDCG
jgi:hypothetical protein